MASNINRVGAESTVLTKAEEEKQCSPKNISKGVTNGVMVLKKLLNGISYYKQTCGAAENARSNREPAENTASPKRIADILLQSELGENERKKAHLKETLLPEFNRRRQREHNMPHRQKSFCLKLRRTRMVEQQMKSGGTKKD